jgi:hypothetical protein
MLEIGLAKLLEMRELTSLESIIERLDALSAGAPPPDGPQSTKAAAAQSTTPEKKTLNDEPETLPPEAFEEQPVDFPQFDEPVSGSTPLVERPEPKATTVRQVRLAPLTSAELEHIADQRLDDAYEEKLSFTGDDLMPITTAAKLAESFSQAKPKPAQSAYSNGSSSVAAAPAIDVSAMIPDHVREEIDTEIPTLSDSPTEVELLAYAEAHPTVRRARRVFQAKIVGVELV